MNVRFRLLTTICGIVVCHFVLGMLVSAAYGQLVIIDQATGADITATYLPEPGQTVELQGGASFVLTTTTNYPGVCTNFGNNADVGPDFTLAGNLLTANDCGGTATITVDGNPVTVPADGNGNEIADILEAQFGGNLTPAEDIELSPSVSDPSNNPDLDDPERRGDGISVFDELERGFIVSDSNPQEGVPLAGFPGFKHIRTDPVNSKDLFVHVVNEQCAPASPPLGRFDRYFPAGGPDMFQRAFSLIPGTHLHLLDYTPGAINPVQSTLWEDSFAYYSVAVPPGESLAGVVWDVSGTKTTTEPQTDRQINKNAVFPLVDIVTGLPIQKGIRLIECQEDDNASILGFSDWGTANKAISVYSKKAGNAIVYSERARSSIAARISGAGARSLSLRVWNVSNKSKWILAPDSVTAPHPPDDIPKTQAGEDLLTRIYIQWLIAHELGHAHQLTNTSELGSHRPSGSGAMMDQTILVTYSKKSAGVTKFHIPDQFLTPDQQEVKMRN